MHLHPKIILKWTAIIILSFNFFIMVFLTYSIPSSNEVKNDIRGIVTRWSTIVYPSYPLSFKKPQFIHEGTPIKVLALYQNFPGIEKPKRWDLDLKWYVELPDHSRGYCTLPEACMGMKLLNEDNDTITIKNIRKTSLYYTFRVKEGLKVYTLPELIVPDVPINVWTPFSGYITYSRFNSWNMFDIPFPLRITINIIGIIFLVSIIIYYMHKRHKK